MSLIEWNDAYSVEVPEIDQQHQSLFALINRLYEAVIEEKDKGQMKSILLELENYTQIHFKMEENYFQEWKYPQAEKHLLEHKTFVKKLNLFRSGFESGVEVGISLRLLDFLNVWLKDHILHSDREYGVYYKEKYL